MFTGIIKDIGKVGKKTLNQEGYLFSIVTPKLINKIAVDDSISINGACQTVIAKKKDTFDVQCVHVSLKKTTLGSLQIGSKVNLELALRMGDHLGGHMVQGHINGKGVVRTIRRQGENRSVIFQLPKRLFQYIIEEGSIAIDGVSLTIAQVFSNDCSFEVSIIPHTFNFTNFGFLKVGDQVNVEIDMIAKYVENFTKQKGYVRESI